ncbi:hypothetical protein Tco_0248446 [Tanacetum coccineum]
MTSLRCAKIDQDMNDEALLLNLDVLEEEREKSEIQEAKKQSKDGTVLQRQGPRHNLQTWRLRLPQQ